MDRLLLSTALTLTLGLGSAAFAQTAPVGGPDAKGNAPVKHAHTVNDGSAKPGANSFTQNQARQHILKSGFTGVSGLTKGADGVWRGTAMRNGSQVDVAMDFKGNVTEGGPAGGASAAMRGTAPVAAPAGPASTPPPAGETMAGGDETASASRSTTSTMHHHHRHHHRRHHAMHHGACANPGPNGVACSGVDRNKNGVSDKEDRAMSAGAHP